LDVGHQRNLEGYKVSWIDKENDEGSMRNYKFTTTSANSDIYIMV